MTAWRFSIKTVWRMASVASGLIQGDSRSLPIANDSIDMVVTDPPYFDSVQYGNLAAFFRVWLARLLPEAAEWNYDETRTAVAVDSADNAGNFASALTGIFAECRRVLKAEHRADGVHISPLGRRRLGGVDHRAENCRLPVAERLRRVFRASHIGAYSESEVNQARQHTGSGY